MRAEVRKRRREVFGRLEGSISRCASEKDLDPLLDALLSLNHSRWLSTGQPGSFVRKPLEERFYREFTRFALARGWLRLVAVKIGGELKAAQIGYVYGDVFYSLQEGFDPEGPPGVGNALRSRVIEDCIAEGVQTYDFLGGFTEHKRRWLAKPRYGHDLFIGRRHNKNALLFAIGFWPTGRYLRPLGMPSSG
jgi:CelD/BcsL family acetyltransferase involved in cellulose biosynthesis